MSRRARIPGTRRGGVLFVLPSIPDEFDDEMKDALAIRNACATEGRCPSCGATGELELHPSIEGLGRLTFRHQDGCKALLGEAAA